MPAIANINSGDRYGNLTVVREISPKISSKGYKRRWVQVRCDCGCEIEIPKDALSYKRLCSNDCICQIGNEMPESEYGETWHPIVETKGLYLISNHGRIWSFKNNKYIKTPSHKNGYLFVLLCFEGKSLYFSVSRLVAKYFVPNPNGYTEVNHRDENKKNNHADNLEWCTRKYNCNYGNRNANISRPVLQYDLNGNLIAEYKSACEATRQTGCDQSDITRCCQGIRKTAKGYLWRYKEQCK